MTEKQFMTLCEKYQVDPADAWDDEVLKEALLWRDDEAVEEILKNGGSPSIEEILKNNY
jgi:hypothetical protein|tara:strand:+ start:884 stop:1060 length:177 start_codon:yes stop_codon:yes gene_type:complete